MASSNRHWPSMFKSKPCNNQQWSQNHDTNHQQSSLLSNSCGRSSSSNSPFSSGCEERTPEPKPRWNPKPEQIRILEAIFNSGMVNPPRDEIRRIRAQLQEYGQVGDANVFYWFQNRKSRSKHKQRTLQAKITATAATITNNTTVGIHHNSPPQPMPTSSSSSSSEKASPREVTLSRSGGGSSSYGGGGSSSNNSGNVVVDQFGNSPTSVNQCNPYFQQLVAPNHHHSTTTHEFVSQDPLFFPLHQSGANFSQGLCYNDQHHQHQLMNSTTAVTIHVPPSSDQATAGGFSSLLLGDMFGGDHSKRDHEVDKFKFQQELSFLVTSAPNTTTCTISSSSPIVHTPTSTAISSNLGQMLGVGEAGGLAGKSTVFINGMAFELPVGPFNVKEEFGEDVLLIHSASGHQVLTNEWGVTLHPLQHGASYFLVGCGAASPLLHKLDSNPDLLAPGFPYQ
ncbi:hypothetical protein SOVF_101380, partial [Spinacia oleracea]